MPLRAAIVLVLAACTGRETPPSSAIAPPAEPAPPAGDPADAAPPPPPAIDAGPPLSEAAARALLAERFRAAGHRIRHDVRLVDEGVYDVTLDGFDPEDRVGFEYVAAAEAETDLTAAERAALTSDESEVRILVLDAADHATVAAAADAFLAR